MSDDDKDRDELWAMAYCAAIAQSATLAFPPEQCALYADDFLEAFTERAGNGTFKTDLEGRFWVDFFEAAATHRQSLHDALDVADEGLKALRNRPPVSYLEAPAPAPSFDTEGDKNLGAKILRLVNAKEKRRAGDDGESD